MYFLTDLVVVLVNFQIVFGVDVMRNDNTGEYHRAHFDSSLNDPDPEGAIRSNLEEWIANVEENGLDPHCQNSVITKVKENKSRLIVEALDCSKANIADDPDSETEEKIVSGFYFTGELDSSGYPQGYGILSLRKHEGAKKSKACLRLTRVLGNGVHVVEGAFRDGVLEGKVTFRWPNEGLEVEALISKGIPHGYFLARAISGDKMVWTVGELRHGEVDSDANCWIVTKEQARYGSCEDAFVFKPESSLLIIPRETSRINNIIEDEAPVEYNHVSVQGSLKGEQLMNASDVDLMEIRGWNYCTRSLKVSKMPTRFVFDLRSTERKFKLHNVDKVCPGKKVIKGRDESAKAIRDYFKKVKFNTVLGVSPDPSDLDTKRATKILSNVERLDSNRYEALLTIFTTHPIEFRYFGAVTSDTNFDGYAVLRMVNKVTCFRGQCLQPEYSRLSGHFVNGLLEGPITLVSADGLSQTGFTATKGIIHGLLAKTGIHPIYPYVGEPHLRRASNGDVDPSLVARFVNGKPSGKVWRGMIADSGLFGNSGWLYGSTEKRSLNMTGDDVAYLYPYYRSALVGKFEQNFMKKASYAYPSSVSCSNGKLDVEFEPAKEDSDAFYFYDPPTNESISSNPTLQDPYEAENIEVASATNEIMGEGLFAKRDMNAGELVGLYAGMIYNLKELETLHETVCKAIANSSNPCDKYSITTYKGATMIILPPYNTTENYRATLAWKANNAFQPEAKVHFHDIEHPRFGLIIGITANQKIRKGEEIFVDYQYKRKSLKQFQDTHHHQWYFDQQPKDV